MTAGRRLTIRELRLSGRAVISVPEAAEVLELGERTAYRWAKDGTIPTIRRGRAIHVPVPALIAMLEGRDHDVDDQEDEEPAAVHRLDRDAS